MLAEVIPCIFHAIFISLLHKDIYLKLAIQYVSFLIPILPKEVPPKFPSILSQLVDKIQDNHKNLQSNSNDPAGLKNLRSCRTFIGIPTYHPLEEFLELLSPEALLMRNFLDLVMELPEVIVLLLLDELVKLVLLHCELKGKFSKQQREEDDSQCKDIALICVVVFVFVCEGVVYFRCHVSLPGSLVLVRGKVHCIFEKVGGESKIANFGHDFSILKTDQYILQFEISMGNSLAVQISHSLCNFPEDLSLCMKVKLMFLDIVKQCSFLGIFEYQDVLRAVQLFIHFITLRGNILLISKSFDDVLMLEGFQNQEFVFQMPLLLLARGGHHLQDHAARLLPVGEQLRVAAPADKRQFVLTHGLQQNIMRLSDGCSQSQRSTLIDRHQGGGRGLLKRDCLIDLEIQKGFRMRRNSIDVKCYHLYTSQFIREFEFLQSKWSLSLLSGTSPDDIHWICWECAGSIKIDQLSSSSRGSMMPQMYLTPCLLLLFSQSFSRPTNIELSIPLGVNFFDWKYASLRLVNFSCRSRQMKTQSQGVSSSVLRNLRIRIWTNLL